MKRKVAMFIFMFVGYCIIFLTWNNWNVTSKQIAEMIFIGTLVGLFNALAMNPMKRLIENVLKK